jgi:large subunit ribosomal protein L13
MSQKTTLMKRETEGTAWNHDWYLVDATDQTLGRLAVRIARVLMGKHKPTYTPHVDVGDYVIVINAGRVRVTGKKLQQKIYYHYSGYPGGLSEKKLEHLLAQRPTRPIEEAVRTMLPKSVLGRRMFKKLKVYAGADHPHQRQNPKPLEF